MQFKEKTWEKWPISREKKRPLAEDIWSKELLERLSGKGLFEQNWAVANLCPLKKEQVKHAYRDIFVYLPKAKIDSWNLRGKILSLFSEFRNA